MSEFKDLKIKFHMSIGYVGANQEDEHNLSDYFDEDDWNALTSDEKENKIHEITKEWSNIYLEVSGWVE